MLMIQDIYAYGPQHVVLVITDTCATMHIVTLLAVESLQHNGSDGRFRARGGRWRKLFGRALRVCRPRLRHSAASATSRGSKSTTDRLAASGLRRSRGHAQPADLSGITTDSTLSTFFSPFLYCFKGLYLGQVSSQVSAVVCL